MNPRTKITFTTLAVTVAACGLTWRELRSVQTSKIALTVVAERRSGLAEQIRRTEQSLTGLERERVNLQGMLDSLHGPRAGEPSPKALAESVDAASAVRTVNLILRPWKDIVLEKDPELQALHLKAGRSDLQARYGSFFAAAGLTADRIEKFNDLMLANSESTLALKVAARAQGADETDPSVAASLREAGNQLRLAQADLLGEAGYGQLQQYERAMPVRDFVNDVAGTLALTEPLNMRQADQLTQILANASPGYRNGGVADVPLLSNEDVTRVMLDHRPIGEIIAWDDVLARAREVLSESQFRFFEAPVVRNRTLIQILNLMQQGSGDPVIGFSFGRQ